MASSLDLQEQEQLDALKAIWRRYGNLVFWILIAALAALAAWNGWQWWQRSQAVNAGAMAEELDRAAAAGDAGKVAQVLNDLQSRYPRTPSTQQAALTAARTLYDKNRPDDAIKALEWLRDGGGEEEFRALANLRLAALQAEKKQYAEAIASIDAVKLPAFAALAADRRGDVLLAQGKADDAKAAYREAWSAMPETLDDRRIVEAKLNALGVSPEAAASSAPLQPAASAAEPRPAASAAPAQSAASADPAQSAAPAASLEPASGASR